MLPFQPPIKARQVRFITSMRILRWNISSSATFSAYTLLQLNSHSFHICNRWHKEIAWAWLGISVQKWTPIFNGCQLRTYNPSISELLLPPANVVCEGYVFTGVCLSTGGMETPSWMENLPQMENPPDPKVLHFNCINTFFTCFFLIFT